ncbi:hypothetical protein D1872_333070 [compost metagenome]
MDHRGSEDSFQELEALPLELSGLFFESLHIEFDTLRSICVLAEQHFAMRFQIHIGTVLEAHHILK